ncbi:hypothetical protein [Zoogloea sp.]|jgi:hypothetical protein
MTTIRFARHAAHASAHDHRARFAFGAGVVAIGAALWLVEMARHLVG